MLTRSLRVIFLCSMMAPLIVKLVKSGRGSGLSGGRRVLITTTTHMFLPESTWPVIFCCDPAMLPRTSLSSPVSFCFHHWKDGDGRHLEQPALPTMKYSRYVEYKIDEKKGTVQQVWEYGKERGYDFYSPITSIIEYQADRNTMFGFGGCYICAPDNRSDSL